MSKPIISIIGLGLTGASIGLGLQRETGNFEIVGHDKDLETAQAARRVGAVQRTEWNLHKTYAGSEMIILAVPFSELDDLLTHIAEDVKGGALVLALTQLLQPAIDLAARRLPPTAHFVAGHPILSGVGSTMSVRADLFDEVTFALAPGIQTSPDAVQLASDLVDRLGATPLFVDALEHDGIIAGVEQLPQVMAAALMRMSSAAPGWREARRLAGRPFAQSSDIGQGAESLYQALQANKSNLLHRIDLMQQELAEWRRLLAEAPEPTLDSDSGRHSVTVEDDAAAPGKQASEEDGKTKKPALVSALEQAVAARDEWEAQAILKNWDEMPKSSDMKQESGGLFRQMFFGNLMGRRRGDQNDREK